MPEIMSIEGIHGRRHMKNYDLPLIDGIGDYLPSQRDLKSMLILGGVGAGAMMAGDLTNLLPATIGGYDTHGKYTKPLLRVLLGVVAHQGLRNYSPEAASVASGLLVGSAVYQLAKPYLAKITMGGLGAAFSQGLNEGLGDILVESRALMGMGEIGPEQIWGLSEVRQDPIAALPAMGEIQQDQFDGLAGSDEFAPQEDVSLPWMT